MGVFLKSLAGLALASAFLGAIAISAFAQTTVSTGPGNSPILKRIADRGSVAIGHREASTPFSFLNSELKVEGYSIDFCLRIVDAIKAQLGRSDLKVQYVPVNVTSRIPLVANGTVDLECGTTTNTLQRQEQVDFSPIIYVTGAQILVPSSSTIADYEGLAGKKVAMLQGSTTESRLRALSEKEDLRIEFLFVRDNAEAVLLVQSGRADGFVTDGALLKIFAATRAKPAGSLKVVGRLLTYEPYGVVMQRGDADFSLLVRKAFAEIFRSGDADRIFEKWFGTYDIKLDDQSRAAFNLQAIPR
ncbi:glutamate/aspartate transport system substrate-binding protein [Mesorhizobium robiniae]|uniref:Glutamate/aspartate transport system substrate-binding protein n=1 Tax=Mesorhizobium robiniae TaxID=559315 RepID=A0ABV2GNN4_9HYPH